MGSIVLPLFNGSGITLYNVYYISKEVFIMLQISVLARV